MCIAAYHSTHPSQEIRHCPICGAQLPTPDEVCLNLGCRGIRLPGETQTIWFCSEHSLLECKEYLEMMSHV